MKNNNKRKYYISIIILIFTCQLSYTQCGFPATIVVLTSQTDVDNFISNWCTNYQGKLYIQDDNDGIDNITNVDAFAGLTNVGGHLIFYQNYSLTSLSGLSSLVSVGQRFNLRENPLITDLLGLSNLQTVGEFFNIGNTLNMTSLQGLENLTSVGWNLIVYDNASLQNLNALYSLNSVQYLQIQLNASLTDISGIQNIDLTTFGHQIFDDVRILDNPLLSVCDNQFVCDFITLASSDPLLTTNIQNNATGCNSEAEVAEACDPCTPSTVTFTALSDICVDGTSETGLSGGNPGGGVYSGPGVTDDGNGMTFTFSSAAAGIGVHTLTYDYTDSNGCQNSASTDIEVLDLPIVAVTSIHTTCNLNNGGATISTTSGIGPFTYTLNDTPVTFPLTDLAAGFYTILAIDANGCTDSGVLNIDPSDPLEVSATPVATTCNLPNGSVSFTTISGTDPVIYTENGQSVSMTDLAPGDYTWDAEDAGGCMSQVSFTIDDSDALEVTPGITSFQLTETISTTCNEDNGIVYLFHDGLPSAFLDITDSSGPITYSTLCVYLTTGGAACVVSDLPAGDYNWTCTDNEGCETDVSFTVDESDPLDITATPMATSCDLDNGSVSFTVNTGIEPIEYSEGGVVITDFTDLAAGDYSWDAVDAHLCTFTVDFTIDLSIAASFTTTPTSTFCDGNNGSVSATMITGNGSLTYTLNGVVNNTGVYTNLAPGTYTMTAVDSEFCPASSTFTINGSDPLEITTVVTPTFCNEDNGSITATLDSGTAPVDYTIAGQGTNTTGAFTDLAPGTYTMNAEDAVGCEATETFTIAPSEPLDINTVIVHTTCELDNGSVTATLMSGTTPVTFTIAGEGSNTTGEFSDLAPGNYTMNAEDAEGCESTVSFVIDDSTLPLFTMETIRTSCGDINGSILLTPDQNTGRAPYEFNIGAGWTSDFTFENLAADNYTVNIRDADGCMTNQETTILDSEQLVYINHIDNADCGNLTGVITLIALEGTGPFLYSISNEFVYRQNSFGTFGFLEAGQYSATVTGTDGCVVTQELTVNNDLGVRMDVEVNHPACGETDGSLQFNLGKTGTPPYKIFVDGNLVEDSLYSDYLISDMANGNYKLEVLDYYGCSDYSEITINDGNSIVEDLVINHIDCEGNFGSITTIIGDAGEYTFTLGGETNLDGSFTELAAGSYTFTATDSMGCDYSKDLVILDHSFTDVRVLVINDECANLSNIKIIPENGTGPYQYFVEGKQYFENGANNLESGFYDVKVIDAKGCSVIQQVKIEGESKFTYIIEKCKAPKFGNPGFLVVKAIGGEGPYSYKLDQYRSKKGQFINLYNSTYTLTITDYRGCSSNFEVQLCESDDQNKALPSLRNNGDDPQVIVYPNPGKAMLNIKYQSLQPDQSIVVYNSTGQLIDQLSTSVESGVISLNTQEWNNGIYFIKVSTTKMIKWIKI